MNRRTVSKWLALMALSNGLLGMSGCDALDKLKGKKDDDSSSDTKKKKKKKDDDDEEEEDDKDSSTSASSTAATTGATTSAASSGSGGETPPADDVKHYPEEVPAGGTFVTKKAFTVYQAADTSSKELGHLGPGTLINLKSTYMNWMLVEWPSGVGELSPGWLEVKVHDTTIQQTQTPVDAGVDAAKPVDAATPVVDAGKAPVDAGRTRPPVLKLPPRK